MIALWIARAALVVLAAAYGLSVIAIRLNVGLANGVELIAVLSFLGLVASALVAVIAQVCVAWEKKRLNKVYWASTEA